jgi:transcriptional regulator with XRE-family HTH domain
MRFKTAAFDLDLAKRGLTQKKLAEIAKLDESTVSRARRGASILPLTAYRIVDALQTVQPIPGLEELVA